MLNVQVSSKDISKSCLAIKFDIKRNRDITYGCILEFFKSYYSIVKFKLNTECQLNYGRKEFVTRSNIFIAKQEHLFCVLMCS